MAEEPTRKLRVLGSVLKTAMTTAMVHVSVLKMPEHFVDADKTIVAICYAISASGLGRSRGMDPGDIKIIDLVSVMTDMIRDFNIGGLRLVEFPDRYEFQINDNIHQLREAAQAGAGN